ncbi:MAG TPA: hypothetical protein VKB35_03320, partial [Ktedonobacteraceae bacterium]|nr:hypothetical protein [Ktedonobacteraceae bacterium]
LCRVLLATQAQTQASRVRLPRPAQLHVGWEKGGEGNPCDPPQARSASEHTRKVVGLVLVLRGHVPACMLSRTRASVDRFPECGRNAGNAERLQGGTNSLCPGLSDKSAYS